MPYGDTDLSQHSLKAPSHNVHQCWHYINWPYINWPLRNNFQWNSIEKYFFMQMYQKISAKWWFYRVSAYSDEPNLMFFKDLSRTKSLVIRTYGKFHNADELKLYHIYIYSNFSLPRFGETLPHSIGQFLKWILEEIVHSMKFGLGCSQNWWNMTSVIKLSTCCQHL